MNLPTLRAVARQAELTPGDVEDYLTAPTGATCPYCGRQNLRRWEQLNGRCERCRLAYAEAAGFWDDAVCGCRLPEGGHCVSGVHCDAKGRPVVRPYGGEKQRLYVEHCPSYWVWWQKYEAPALRRRQAKRSKTGLEDL